MGLTIPCTNTISLYYSIQMVSCNSQGILWGIGDMESGDFDKRQHLMTVNGPLDLRVELFAQNLC